MYKDQKGLGSKPGATSKVDWLALFITSQRARGVGVVSQTLIIHVHEIVHDVRVT